jgi:DNA-binding NarL/FixJ family response regulator
VSISVLIADDQQLVRAGFALILKPHTDLEVVGEAADGGGFAVRACLPLDVAAR